jgi:ATP-dependent DNA helicase RecG
VLIRKRFSHTDDLKSAVYAALVRYLEEKEIIRVGPFDASTNPQATLADISNGKLKKFVQLARSKRGFPLGEQASVKEILTHLNLLNGNKICNAALLLFGKSPQHFFINSEVRCAYFRGIEVAKPIPSYKVFKGDVFELVDQAAEFVLSKLDYSVGTRAKSTSIPGKYEIPKEIISEALVNAVAHRDYTSNASVQVMLFKDRLEIWNPGSLPLGWTTDNLKRLHTSVPANPLLAEPMYLAGYIERLGTGTSDMVRIARENGLKEPEFLQEEIFKTIIYRPGTDHDTDYDTDHDTDHDTVQVKRLILILHQEQPREDLMQMLDLKHIPTFRGNYLNPALKDGYIEMTLPEKPTSKKQQYRLTTKGKALQKKLKSRK